MKEYAARPNPRQCPTDPGQLLREEILPAIRLGKSALAQALGISRQRL
jgi:plasmid maintenance system antidote protein VapI